MMRTVESLAQDIRIKKACEVLGIPRASYYYYQKHTESFFRDITPSIPYLEVDGFVKTIYYYFVDAFLNEQQETKG